MKKIVLNTFYALLIFLLESSQAFCQTYVASPAAKSGTNLGTVADNLSQTSDLFKAVLDAVFYVIGFVFVFGSLIRYHEHRKNPSQTPISRVVFLLIAGLVIGFFPYMAAELSGKFQH
jgi:hypothetical protein